MSNIISDYITKFYREQNGPTIKTLISLSGDLFDHWNHFSGFNLSLLDVQSSLKLQTHKSRAISCRLLPNAL